MCSLVFNKATTVIRTVTFGRQYPLATSTLLDLSGHLIGLDIASIGVQNPLLCRDDIRESNWSVSNKRSFI